jgi:hypothetical protein
MLIMPLVLLVFTPLEMAALYFRLKVNDSEGTLRTGSSIYS